MQTKQLTGAIALMAIVSVSIGVPACSASSQGLSSRNFDSRSARSGKFRSQPNIATVPTLDLDLSVAAAYAAIPHRRTNMDFAAANMPERDKRFLQVAFHIIDQAIRLRVTAYQKFSRGGSQSMADIETLIDYLESLDAPDSLSSYQDLLIKALSDQQAFFHEWQSQGQQFRYGSAETIGQHGKVQSASKALREAYGILIETYHSESDRSKTAFFDYHCALDFI